MLLVIPLIFCIVLYFSVQQIIHNQLKTNAEHTVEQFQLQVSSMMHEANLISDALVCDLVALDNNNDNSNFLLYSFNDPSSICRQISIRKGNGTYTDHVYYVSMKHQKIYSDEGYYNFNSLESILNKLGIQSDDFFSVTESTWNMMAGNHLSDPYCITPFHDNSGEIDGYILITLNLEIFTQAILDPSSEFSCLYNENTFITSQTISTDYSASDLESEKTVSAILGKSVKCFFVHVNDFTYMVAIKTGSYYYPLIILSLCFLIYAAIIFVLGFLYLYKVSKQRYIQMSDLIKALPQENASVSYQNLVPTVQNALLAFRDQSESQQRTLNEHILQRILHSQYPANVLEHNLDQIGIPTQNAAYYVAIFYIKSYNNIALVSSATEDVSHMAWIIFQTAVKQFTGSSFNSFSCQESDSFATVFYTLSDEHFSRHVRAACESISKFVNDGYGIQLHVAISHAISDPQEIASAFYQAQNLERFSVAIDNTSKIISEEILRDNGGLLLKGDFFRQEQTLINTLLVGKYDIVPSMVNSILQEHVAPLTSDYQLSISRLNAIANILAEALLCIHIKGMDYSEAAKQLQQADSISALTTRTETVFAQLTEAMANAPVSYPEVANAQEYIADHLSDQNLNVTMICEAVGIIVQRLTPMFQEQLGMGIAEYVNYRRIEESKKLLTDTKLTVKQIAAEIGYSTTDTLTRNFRKLENMTPTEYRKLAYK